MKTGGGRMDGRSFAIGLAVVLLAMPARAQKKPASIAAAQSKSRGLVGNPAPDFTLPGADGRTFNLADQRGKIVVLAFWATWCPPCRAEMPMFARLQKELISENAVVAPVANDDPAKARDFLAKKKLDVWSLLDDGHAVSKLYGANALPATFILDRDGVVVKAILGKASEADLRKAIQLARR
ncbi:MAG: TlpA disulfide reductase family protein [Bryobacteraceae bacterium]|jgi:peroxiredoxin